jgi:hypothetical protein
LDSQGHDSKGQQLEENQTVFAFAMKLPWTIQIP